MKVVSKYLDGLRQGCGVLRYGFASCGTFGIWFIFCCTKKAPRCLCGTKTHAQVVCFPNKVPIYPSPGVESSIFTNACTTLYQTGDAAGEVGSIGRPILPHNFHYLSHRSSRSYVPSFLIFFPQLCCTSSHNHYPLSHQTNYGLICSTSLLFSQE